MAKLTDNLSATAQRVRQSFGMSRASIRPIEDDREDLPNIPPRIAVLIDAVNTRYAACWDVFDKTFKLSGDRAMSERAFMNTVREMGLQEIEAEAVLEAREIRDTAAHKRAIEDAAIQEAKAAQDVLFSQIATEYSRARNAGLQNYVDSFGFGDEYTINIEVEKARLEAHRQSLLQFMHPPKLQMNWDIYNPPSDEPTENRLSIPKEWLDK